ncbi:heterokaryon incompatibility protein-domain-containing protein [Hypoxylon sp. FL1284]|nr:heterokaryon incompatibility protein-domain-containing protein [Hypoxylon sp. FL1284]
MICQTCQTAIQTTFVEVLTFDLSSSHTTETRNPFESRVLHSTPYSLYRSVAAACLICCSVWVSDLKERKRHVPGIGLEQLLEGRFSQTYEEFRNLSLDDSPAAEHVPNSIKDGDSGQPWVSFWAEPFMEEIHFVTRLQVLDIRFDQCLRLPDVGPHFSISAPCNINGRSTARSASLWTHWLRTCSESHVKCRITAQQQQSFVPKRLIEILDTGRQPVDSDRYEWRLVHDTGVGVVPYVTLSHCWGTSEHLILTAENYSELMEVSPDTLLPKTYRDALRIATSLGFRYIWIDSLCIIQGDEDDWKAQSSKMGLVYSTAWCNIAATWAKDVADGCFSDRTPDVVDPVFKSDLTVWTTFYRMTLTPGPSFDEDVTHAPLNKRAWVIQERYLARRQLMFSKRQVYWECWELCASEQFPRGTEQLPRGMPMNVQSAHIPTAKPSMEVSAWSLNQVWKTLVDLYSACHATRNSDRLIALAGLAGIVQQTRGAADEYLAGLWKKNLRTQLCWRADERAVNRSRILPYIAPSWSWASLDGPVILDDCYVYLFDDYAALADVAEVHVDSSDDTKLHSFTGSKLVLRGIGIWARPVPLTSGKGVSETEEGYELQGHDGNIVNTHVTIFWDENMSRADDRGWSTDINESRTQELLFMCVSSCGDDIYGLVLRKSSFSSSQGSYVRIGAFTRGFSLIIRIAKKLGFDRDERTNSFVNSTEGTKAPFYNMAVDLEDARLADLAHTVTII